VEQKFSEVRAAASPLGGRRAEAEFASRDEEDHNGDGHDRRRQGELGDRVRSVAPARDPVHQADGVVVQPVHGDRYEGATPNRLWTHVPTDAVAAGKLAPGADEGV